MHESPTLSILDMAQVAVKRWYILVTTPLVIMAVAYFLLPSVVPTFSGTASLATNQHPTPVLMDKAISAGKETGLTVTIQETGKHITATTSANSEEKVRATLEAAMAPFLTAKIIQDDREITWAAEKERLTNHLEILQNAMNTLTSNPPQTANADYNPSSYVDSILILSSKMIEVSERLFDIEHQNSLPLAVSGVVSYDFQVHQGNSWAVMIAVIGLTTLVGVLLCLVALEALRRQSTATARS